MKIKLLFCFLKDTGPNTTSYKTKKPAKAGLLGIAYD